MGLNNNDNLFQSESIFQSAKNFEENMHSIQQPQQTQALNGLLGKLVKNITTKLNEYDTAKEAAKIQKIFQKEEDILKLLINFGCKLQYIDNNNIELFWVKQNIKGVIHTDKKGLDAFDENAQKIIRQIVNIILSSNNLENSIDRLEAEGFYPVGELEKTEAIIENQKCEVLVGTFQNNNGEIQKIYFYNGREVFLKEENS